MQFRPLRIDVSARVIGVWALALPGLMLGSLIVVIATFSVPFLIAAAVLSLWFGAAILRRPILWSLAAIAIPLFGGYVIFGRAGLLRWPLPCQPPSISLSRFASFRRHQETRLT